MRKKATGEFDEKLEFRRCCSILARRKWHILGLAAAAGLAASLIAFAMTPIYRAAVTVSLAPAPADVTDIVTANVPASAGDPQDTRRQAYLAAQLKALRSPALAATIVRSLALTERAEFATERAPSTLTRLWRDWLPSSIAASSGRPEPDPLSDAVDAYLDRLFIEPVSDARLIRIGFESTDPALAADVANQHASAYVGSQGGARAIRAAAFRQWTSARLEQMQLTLRASEKRLADFHAREQIFDVEALLVPPAQKVNALSASLSALRQSLAATARSNRQIARSGPGLESLRDIPGIRENERVQQLRQAEAQARQTVTKRRQRYGPRHPSLINAERELAQAIDNLNNESLRVAITIRNRHEALRVQEVTIVAALERASRDYGAVVRKAAQLSNLQRAVETNRRRYDSLQSRVQQAAAGIDLRTAPLRVASPAFEPQVPVKPNKPLIVGLSVLVSLLAGIGIALVRESRHNTIDSAADARHSLRRPLLGSVPVLSGQALKAARMRGQLGAPSVADKGFTDAIRTIRAAISLDSLEYPHKVILLTSSVSGEGKAMLSLNLAESFAGFERTLLIDADMRRPAVAKMIGLRHTMPGISELLSKRAELEHCLLQTGVEDLFVITTGTIPHDPLKLLSSPKMQSLLDELGESFERIVINCAPSLPVNHAAVLAKHAESVVYVVKAGATPVPQINKGLKLLQRANAPITGIVLNQLSTQRGKARHHWRAGRLALASARA